MTASEARKQEQEIVERKKQEVFEAFKAFTETPKAGGEMSIVGDIVVLDCCGKWTPLLVIFKKGDSVLAVSRAGEYFAVDKEIPVIGNNKEHWTILNLNASIAAIKESCKLRTSSSVKRDLAELLSWLPRPRKVRK